MIVLGGIDRNIKSNSCHISGNLYIALFVVYILTCAFFLALNRSAYAQASAPLQATADGVTLTNAEGQNLSCDFCVNIDANFANVKVYNYGSIDSVTTSIRGYGHFLSIYNYGTITARYIGVDNV